MTPDTPDTLKTWPEKIYLQHGAPELPPYSECTGVTFAGENVHGNDVGYTRDDLAQPKQAAPPDTKQPTEYTAEQKGAKHKPNS